MGGVGDGVGTPANGSIAAEPPVTLNGKIMLLISII